MSQHLELDLPGEEEVDPSRRWVQTWRAAVRSCPSPVGLAELPSTRFLELSQPAAELLGTTPAEAVGKEALAFLERPYEVAVTAWLLLARIIDAGQSRRRWRRADGSVVEATSIGRAIRSSRAGDLVLWVADDVVARGADESTLDGSRRCIVRLDGEWRGAAVEGALDQVLGYHPRELVGKAFLELVHPDDLVILLLALARATSGGSVGERVLRLSHRDGFWRPVGVRPTATEDGGIPQFSLLLRAVETSEDPSRAGATKLEDHLRRIAMELQAAGVVLTARDALEDRHPPALTDLSPRQQEVVSRLMRGERVPRIAKAMYLSQSTVRNHLAMIFRKFGVHSQEELLAELRGGSRSDPPGA